MSFQVGDEVRVVRDYYRNATPEPAKVVKIGRRYLYTDRTSNTPFDKLTGQRADGYSNERVTTQAALDREAKVAEARKQLRLWGLEARHGMGDGAVLDVFVAVRPIFETPNEGGDEVKR